ncbi:MAG: TIGR00300 family protein [Egibacteraceae bacterium]
MPDEPAHAPLVEQVVELRGHILDSGLLGQVLDEIRSRDADYEIARFDVGKRHGDPSYLAIVVRSGSADALAGLVAQLQAFGANPAEDADVSLAPAPTDGVLPDDFYCTTNLPTRVRVDGRWLAVDRPERDCAVAVEPSAPTARTVAIDDVTAGTLIACGVGGIQVTPRQRPRDGRAPSVVFDFGLSPELPQTVLVDRVAEAMQQARAAGTKVLVTAGSAVVTTGGVEPLSRLIRSGYVDVLVGGNALAVGDLRAAMFGASSPTSARTAEQPEHGREQHLRAVNRVRRAGSIAAAVAEGVVTHGIMAEAVRHDVDVLLAASVRDDALLPDTVRDTVEAQRRLRERIPEVGFALAVATHLHAGAVANLLPAGVPLVTVDLNPTTVGRLAVPGVLHRAGIVTDAGLFLRELAQRLAPRTSDSPR